MLQTRHDNHAIIRNRNRRRFIHRLLIPHFAVAAQRLGVRATSALFLRLDDGAHATWSSVDFIFGFGGDVACWSVAICCCLAFTVIGYAVLIPTFTPAATPAVTPTPTPAPWCRGRLWRRRRPWKCRHLPEWPHQRVILDMVEVVLDKHNGQDQQCSRSDTVE